MGRPRKHDGVVYKREGSKIWWMRYREKSGKRREESTAAEDWDEAQSTLRQRLQARDENSLGVVRKGQRLSFSALADLFLENYSKPPMRAEMTHIANLTALKSLRRVFGSQMLSEIDSDEIEGFLRQRLRQRKKVKRASGVVELGLVKPATAHQEFRVLRRILNVAVKKKLMAANPCAGVEFPVRVQGLFRPHYTTWSEQQSIEFDAPPYLKNVIQIITESGLRVYKELASMRKEQIDVANAVVFISDSKTPNGVAEVPLTEAAVAAFKSQVELSGPGPFLFPSQTSPTGYQKTFKNVWAKTLRKAGVKYFRLYDLRSTYATRLSAGGVADEWVTQLLRQGDSKVFKKYSQMKLQMKREAHLKLNRSASEQSVSIGTFRPN